MSKDKKEKLPQSVYVVILALIIDLLGFTVILPLIPSILDLYDQDKVNNTFYGWLEEKIRDFQFSVGAPDAYNKVLFGGFLGSMFSILQYLSSPIAGALSDVYGRKPIMLLSMIGICLSHIVWLFSFNFPLFILARIIGGISKANVSLTAAIITDLCCTKTRGLGMALVGAAFAIGFIIGPIIGALFSVHISDINQHLTFDVLNSKFVLPALFAISMSLLDIILFAYCFEESLPSKNRAKSIGTGMMKALNFINPVCLFSFNPVQNVSAKDKSSLQQIGLIYFLFLFLYSGLEYSLTFLTHIRFMFSSMQQGKMYLFSGIIMVVIQGGVMRRIPPGKEIYTALIGAVVIVPSFVIIGLSRSLGVFYFGLALYAVASSTVVPCLTTIISKLGSADQKGTVLGIFRSLGSLARGLGPLLSSVAYWILGPTISYCLGGLLLVIPALLIYQLESQFRSQTIKSQ